MVRGKTEEKLHQKKKSNTVYQVILKQLKKTPNPCFAQWIQELFRIHEQIELV